MKESKTISRVVAAVLTVAFLGYVFLTFGYMMLRYGDNIIYAARMTGAMASTLPENATPFDKLAARINGFKQEIEDLMWLKTEMGYINSDIQYALGKQVITTASQNMIRTTTGQLYDLANYKPLENNAREIVDIRTTTLRDCPFLFVYEQPTLYREDMLPEEYRGMDSSWRMADEVIALLRENDIEVLDSRDVLNASGYDLNDLLMYTDQHWSTLAAIVMAQSIADRLNEMCGMALDRHLIDLDQLNTLVHEKLFLGKYGQRVGPDRIDPDDIVEYWPKYDTWIKNTTLAVANLTEKEGPFRSSVLNQSRLEPDPGKTWNTMAYTDYGLVESYNLFTNESAPDYTILLLKDSYSAPIGAFLSLLARHVICVDMRRNVDPLETWVERYHPDAVVMGYSLSMLRDEQYRFE